jgi:hypothetical protein
MTIKHGAHTFNIDPASTDTYRHYHEGQRSGWPWSRLTSSRWSSGGPTKPAPEKSRRRTWPMPTSCSARIQTVSAPEDRNPPAPGAPQPLFGGQEVASSTWIAMVTDVETGYSGIRQIRLDSEGWLESLADLVERDIMRRSGIDAHRSRGRRGNHPGHRTADC